MREELCNTIYDSNKNLVVIRRPNGEMFKVNANNSVFAKSLPLLQIMDGRWIAVSMNIDSDIIKGVSYNPADIHITSNLEKNDSVRDIIPRAGLKFNKISNLKEIYNDEKLSLRMTYIYSSYESVTHSYELQVMSYLEPFVKLVNDTELIISVQKICLVEKKIPEYFLKMYDLGYLSSCSPYMFFKICEMALKYHLVSIDEFVYSLPCLPYVDYHCMNSQKRKTLGTLRTIKDELFRELEERNKP